MKTKAIIVGIVCGAFLAAASAGYGAGTAWNVSAGDWGVAGNWTNGEPTGSAEAYINNGGTVTVSQAGEICSNLYCQTGVVRIVSGTLFATNEYFGLNAGQYGLCVQDGGSNHIDAAGANQCLTLGQNAGATGVYILSAGYITANETSWGGEYIGRNGYGRFIQTGGTNMVHDFVLAKGTGSEGVYDLSNGYVVVGVGGRGVYIPDQGKKGTFNQSGGRLGSANMVCIGSTVGTGTYNLVGGEMYFLAWTGPYILTNGTLNMGDTNGTGKIWGSGGYLWINAGGTLRGWGTNSCSGRFDMSGRVMADGWPGTPADRTLEMTGFTDLRYPVKNTTSNGWFAVNRGKLMLSPLTIATGTTTQFWGDTTTNPPNDLVNSVGLIFTNVTVGGTITHALLALDRSDLPPQSSGVRCFIGAWQMIRPAALAFGSLTLSFRYDDDARAGQGIDPGNLTLWHSTGGAWSAMPTTVNAADKLVNTTITTLATNEYFALGSPWFSKGTILRTQ